MNAGFFLFIIAVFLMLVSSIIIAIIVRFRKRKAEDLILNKLENRAWNFSRKNLKKHSSEEISEEEGVSNVPEEIVGEGGDASNLLREVKGQGEVLSNYRVIMKLSISIVVLIVGLIIIFSERFGDEEKKWAYGSLGAILGYWFK